MSHDEKQTWPETAPSLQSPPVAKTEEPPAPPVSAPGASTSIPLPDGFFQRETAAAVLSMIERLYEKSQARSTFITFSISRVDLVAHLEERASFYAKESDRIDEIVAELAIADAEVNAALEAKDPRFLQYREQLRESLIAKAKGYAFLASHVSDCESFVLSFHEAKEYELVPYDGILGPPPRLPRVPGPMGMLAPR